MSDGERLCIDVFRPSGAGKYPALLGMSPYGKEIQSLPMAPQPPTSPVYSRQIEAGDPRSLTGHGYAHIIADVRGIGKSTDVYRGWMSADEARDGYDLIEWIAGQPWCDGNVGMVGVSYYGAIQLAVAATRPPALKAIMPFNAPADFYRECTYHGGILQTFFNYLYRMPIRGRLQSAVVERSTAEELAALIARFAADPDLQQYPDLYNAVVNPDRVPGFFDIVVQPYDSAFYRERSPNATYDKITIPAYVGSGWWAYGHMHLRGAFDNFVGLSGPTKIYIEGRTESPAPLGDEFNDEVVRWYDYWLKGIETGILDEPSLKLELRGGTGPRLGSEWPLPQTAWTELYLRRWGRLSATPETEAGNPDHFVQQPVTQTATVASVEYVTEPLTTPLELTGPVALALFAAIDRTDTNWIVALSDVAPNGREVEIARGFLKASHRATDAARSTTWHPYHPHREAVPVAPGEAIEYAIDLTPLANVFRSGHSIKLTIACLDHAYWPPADLEIGGANHMPWHVARSEAVGHQIFHDSRRPSRLLLPVIPGKARPS